MTVFDASALLAFLQGERGAEEVERRLGAGGSCGAVNWSETAQKVLAAGADWAIARQLLLSYPLQIEPVTEADAESAARMWRIGSGLSLADRLCMSLGTRLDVPVVTADRAWSEFDGVVVIR